MREYAFRRPLGLNHHTSDSTPKGLESGTARLASSPSQQPGSPGRDDPRRELKRAKPIGARFAHERFYEIVKLGNGFPPPICEKYKISQRYSLSSHCIASR